MLFVVWEMEYKKAKRIILESGLINLKNGMQNSTYCFYKEIVSEKYDK